MASFGGMVLTNRGRNLLAKAQAGIQLNFTRIAVGDGNLVGSSIVDLNALIHQVKSLNITKLKTMTGGKAVVGAVLSNQDITSGFYFREIGVFAQDPDVGEILYCYANCGATAEYIPAGGGPDIIEKSFDIITVIGNASNVTATIDSSLIYASAQALTTHENNDAIHVKKDGTLQVGLNAEKVGGKTASELAPASHTHTKTDIADLIIDNFVFGENSSATRTANPDEISKSGFYLSTSNYVIESISDWWLILHIQNAGASGYAFQIASALQKPGIQFCRSCINGIWSTWARIWTNKNLGIGCKLTHSLNQSIASDMWVTLNFDTEIFDDNNFHNTVTNNQQITITVKGRYLIGGIIQWDANSIGRREIGIAKNGTIITSTSQTPVMSPDFTQMHCQTIDDLNIGDYLELKVFQSSGNPLNIKSSNTSPYFYIVKVG